MPAFYCPDCHAPSDLGDGAEWTCPRCGKTLAVMKAKVCRRRKRRFNAVFWGRLLAAAGVLALAAISIWWMRVCREPEYWSEQQMYEHLRANGLPPSYQLTQGILGAYLVDTPPGGNAAAMVAAYEAGPAGMMMPKGMVLMESPGWFGDSRQAKQFAERHPDICCYYRGWVFSRFSWQRGDRTLSDIRRCLGP